MPRAQKKNRFPTAREVKDVLGHVDIGHFRVSHNSAAGQQNMRFLWEVRGPETPAGGCREVLDEFATYREAVADARAREKKRSEKAVLEYARFGHKGREVLEALDDAIKELLDIYYNREASAEHQHEVLWHLLDVSRSARRLPRLHTLPTHWTEEERETP